MDLRFENSLKNTVKKYLILVAASVIVSLAVSGCGGDDKTTSEAGTSTASRQTTTSATQTAKTTEQAGIKLDPNLQSKTGTPSPPEMTALINLQKKVPYPVIVPTDLPSGYNLEVDLIGYGGKTAKDPVGYYSFRYADPSNANRSLTFNQSLSNSKPLSGYYLTEVETNGVNYQVYWHKTREYLPQGDPVRTDSVGEAETFVVVWQGQYTDPSTGKPQELWYNMQSGTWTTSWSEIQTVLSNLKPLSAVAE